MCFFFSQRCNVTQRCAFFSYCLLSAKLDGVHKEFQKAIGAAVCRYVPERGVLLAISRHENIRRHCGMLQEMHFRNLSQKVITIFQHVKIYSQD